jgi:acetyltransferase
VTRDGVVLHVAQAAPEDRTALRAFFGKMTPDDLRFRFLEAIKTVDDAVIRHMVEGVDDVTFLARNGADGALVAVATLATGGDRQKADVALATLPAWKSKGVSWTLLEHVLACAKERGFVVVSSLEAAGNHAAIALEREMGFVARLNSADPPEVLTSKKL